MEDWLHSEIDIGGMKKEREMLIEIIIRTANRCSLREKSYNAYFCYLELSACRLNGDASKGHTE